MKTFIYTGLSALATTFLGAMCNVATVIANGGRMPVVEDYCPYGFVLDSRHICAGTSAKLNFLIDRFHFADYIYSPGDFIISIGQVLAVLALMILIRDLLGKRKTKM
jgi:hypothetical protein